MNGDRYLLYIVGEPASGKSRLVEALTAGIEGVPMSRGLIRYRALQTSPQVIELGIRRESFSGTDALAMNVQPEVQRWLEGPDSGNYVLGEGDRLANMKFFRSAFDSGWYVHVACLEASDRTLARRRYDRAFMLGVKPQDETWVRGRRSKLRNLMHALPKHCVSYHRHDDGATADVVREIVEADPVAKILQGGAS